MKERILLTAFCGACRSTFGHDMACSCTKLINLNQNESSSPEISVIEEAGISLDPELIGYTH